MEKVSKLVCKKLSMSSASRQSTERAFLLVKSAIKIINHIFINEVC